MAYELSRDSSARLLTHLEISERIALACAGAAFVLAFILAVLGDALGLRLAVLALAGLTCLAVLRSALWSIEQRRTRSEELASVRDHFGGILESAMDPIVTADSEQRIVLFNAAAERAFGYVRERIVGQPLEVLIPTRFRASHQGHVELFAKAGVTIRRMGGQAILWAQRVDGSEFPIEASISQHAVNGEKLFTVILRDVSERVRTEEALRRSKDELSALANAADTAREEEKTRISRELHDELAQALTALKMDVAWTRKRLPPDLPDLDQKLGRVEETLNETVAATRRIAADLRPMMLDDLGIAAAAEWLVEKFIERTGVHCSLSFDIGQDDIPETFATALFRILQESLTNIARHAQASAAEVSISRTDAALRLNVRDNGRGFSSTTATAGRTFGILGIKERAYMLGGEVTIDSGPDRGTCIEVRLPLVSRTALA